MTSPGPCAAQVCAPYSALQGYKLKVKLTPGTQKKGKGGRQARLSLVELHTSRSCPPITAAREVTKLGLGASEHVIGACMVFSCKSMLHMYTKYTCSIVGYTGVQTGAIKWNLCISHVL